MTDDTDNLTLSDLSVLTDVPQRTVRYYIQQGLVDRPEGEKRWARYGARHVEQLLGIRKWQRAGLSLDRIRELLRPEDVDGLLPPAPQRAVGDVHVRSFVTVAPGIEIAIDPAEARLSPEDIRHLASRVARLVEDLNEERDDGRQQNPADG